MKVKISEAPPADLLPEPINDRRHRLRRPRPGHPAKRSRATGSRPFVFAMWALMLFLAALPSDARDQSNQEETTDIRISTAWSADQVRPGDRILFAIILEMDEGLHINADTKQLKPISGFKPFPTELKVVSGTEGFVTELPYYPQAHPVKFDFADEALMVFDGRVVIYLPIQIDDPFEAPELKLDLQLAYQACGKDFCLFPERVTRTVTRPLADPGATVSAINQDVFADFQRLRAAAADQAARFDLYGWTFSITATSAAGWLLILLTAALGGLLLNVTPCVLPMIPIKVMSLAQASDHKSRLAALGLATFAGVVVFWTLLGLLIAFVSDFTAANQLFQYPGFTIAVGVIIAVMGAGMIGAFSVSLPQLFYRFNPQQKTLSGSFCIGVLIAVLSTPCTAPFMGTAAAFAITQSSMATLATFLSIGFGMGIPYLLLAMFPALVSRIPNSGPISEIIKQVMGVLMLAAAAYFIGVGITVLMADPQAQIGKGYWWPVMALCAVAGAWLALKSVAAVAGKKLRMVMAAVGIVVIGISVWGGLQLTDKGPINWITYSEEQLQKALSENKVVVLVFTAEWCLNCRAIETRVFSDPLIADLLGRPSVAPMKADITGNNAPGKAKLRELGHLTIPLAVVLAKNGRMVFKSDFYTTAQLSLAVEEALGPDGTRPSK